MHARTVAPSFRPVRAVLLVLTTLAAVVAVALPTAGPARAAVPDRWGFAFLDNPTPPAGYVPDPTRQWGSWPSPASNPVKVDQLAVGSYLVHFPFIALPGRHRPRHRRRPYRQLVPDQGLVHGGHWAGRRGELLPAGRRPRQHAVHRALHHQQRDPVGRGGSYGYTFSDISGAVLAQYNSMRRGQHGESRLDRDLEGLAARSGPVHRCREHRGHRGRRGPGRALQGGRLGAAWRPVRPWWSAASTRRARRTTPGGR